MPDLPPAHGSRRAPRSARPSPPSRVPKVRSPYDRGPDERINRTASIPFFLVHVLALVGPFVFGISARAVVVFLVMVWGREWFITAGYHRYFAHRAYKTSRAFQLFLAVGGATAPRRARCGGPATTASTTATATPSSTSTRRCAASGGATWAGSCATSTTRCPIERIRDFAKYPELRFVDKWNGLFPWLAAIAAVPLRRMVGPVLRLLARHGRALAQHVPGELARPRHGPPPLRHRRHQPELAADRHHHPGRGLAQQPPLLPGVGPQRLLLVGDRRHLLRAQGAQLGRSGARSQGAQRRDARRQPGEGRQLRHRHVQGALGPGPGRGGPHPRQPRHPGSRTPGLHAAGALADKRDAIELAIETRKAVLDEFVQTSMASAEELARVTRRGNRELGPLDG